eukprot:gene3348-4147_t
MAEDPHGMFAMHLASLGGHVEVLKWLISLKVSVHVVDRNYMTPLHHACDCMHPTAVLVLVDAGANLLAKNSYGLTPLHYICLRGLVDLQHLLRPYTVNLTSNSGLTCLHCASDGGHERMVLYLLKSGAHVDAKDFEGLTPLHYACLSGHWSVAQCLVEHGAFWNARDDEGMSPMLYACSEGYLEIVQWLVALGGSLFARNDYGNNGLHLACASGSVELVNWLLVKGVNLNSRNKEGLTPFHFACEAGHIELANFLSAAGVSMWADTGDDAAERARVDEDSERFLRDCELAEYNQLNQKGEEEVAGVEGDGGRSMGLVEEGGAGASLQPSQSHGGDRSPVDGQLREACAKGNLELVEKLLGTGRADPNCQNSNGSSPLHFACAIGHGAIAERLLLAGANINIANSKNSTPLHFACDRNHSDLILWLVRNGADIYARNGEGYTPLHYLATRGHAALLRAVSGVREDFDANCSGTKDISLLHCAAEQGHVDMVRLLLSLGAVVDSVDDENETPLHYACLRGHLDAAMVLVEHKAVINARDNEGSTPLFYACSSGNVQLSQWLRNQGALLHNINRRGNTCLHVACKVGNKDMALWLIEAGVDVHSKNINGHSPMDFAITGNHTELVQALEAKLEEAELFAIAQLETRAMLHKAAAAGNVQVVSQVLREGLDINSKDEKLWSAMHFAAANGH